MMRANYKNFIIKTAYIIIDLVFISLAIYLACLMRHTTVPWDITFQNIFLNPDNAFQFTFVFWVVSTIFVLRSHSLYQTRRELLEGFEITEVVKAVLLSALLVIVCIYVVKTEGFPRSILAIGSAFNALFLSIWRIGKRIFVEYLVANGYNNFNAIIIGAGKAGRALKNEIEKKPQLGIQVAGFLDDYKTNETFESNRPILGKIPEFHRIAKQEFIDKVYITIHNDHKMFLSLLEQAKDLGVAVSVIPQGFELISSDCRKYNVGIVPVLEYCDSFPLKKQFGKRLFDFLVSLVSVAVLLPFYIGIAILIKIDSRGPAFYISKRYGRNGRMFKMYKFRSMRVDAEQMMKDMRAHNEHVGPIFKMKNDPRITKIGRFLRKSSLDELPQLFNVLKGEMSLVGPRPLPIDQVEREDFNQLKRLEVRPGITGLWQIRGRSDVSFNRLVKWDMWYINNWSFWLDWNILLQTLPVVIKGRGAY